MMLSKTLPPRLSRNNACHYLKERYGIVRSPKTLAKYATVGGGPLFEKAGRAALYKPADLDAWACSILSGPLHSTSDASNYPRSATARAAAKVAIMDPELAAMLS